MHKDNFFLFFSFSKREGKKRKNLKKWGRFFKGLGKTKNHLDILQTSGGKTLEDDPFESCVRSYMLPSTRLLKRRWPPSPPPLFLKNKVQINCCFGASRSIFCFTWKKSWSLKKQRFYRQFDRYWPVKCRPSGKKKKRKRKSKHVCRGWIKPTTKKKEFSE